jgi:hypothetical protein
MVAHTGFEPVISSLRGRCPKPLDECATLERSASCSQKFTTGLLEKFIISRPQGASSKVSVTLRLITIPFLPAIENYVLRIAVGWKKEYKEDRISLDRVYHAVLCYTPNT